MKKVFTVLILVLFGSAESQTWKYPDGSSANVENVKVGEFLKVDRASISIAQEDNQKAYSYTPCGDSPDFKYIYIWKANVGDQINTNNPDQTLTIVSGNPHRSSGYMYLNPYFGCWEYYKASSSEKKWQCNATKPYTGTAISGDATATFEFDSFIFDYSHDDTRYNFSRSKDSYKAGPNAIPDAAGYYSDFSLYVPAVYREGNKYSTHFNFPSGSVRVQDDYLDKLLPMVRCLYGVKHSDSSWEFLNTVIHEGPSLSVVETVETPVEEIPTETVETPVEETPTETVETPVEETPTETVETPEPTIPKMDSVLVDPTLYRIGDTVKVGISASIRLSGMKIYYDGGFIGLLETTPVDHLETKWGFKSAELRYFKDYTELHFLKRTNQDSTYIWWHKGLPNYIKVFLVDVPEIKSVLVDSSETSVNPEPASQDSTETVVESLPPSADFDGNGIVGISDFMMFSDAWEKFGESQEWIEHKPNWEIFDLDQDGDVDLDDFAIFVVRWGTTG